MTNLLLYIDPNSGSMIFQAAIAGIMGFIMSFKHLKLKISKLFNKNTQTINLEEDIEN